MYSCETPRDESRGFLGAAVSEERQLHPSHMPPLTGRATGIDARYVRWVFGWCSAAVEGVDDAQGGGEHAVDVAMGVFRPEVGGSYDIAVADKSTRFGSTPNHPPAWFVSMPARWTGLAGVGFGNQHHRDSVASGFVHDGRAYPSVEPLTDLLLAFFVQSLAVPDVSYIAPVRLLRPSA